MRKPQTGLQLFTLFFNGLRNMPAGRNKAKPV